MDIQQIAAMEVMLERYRDEVSSLHMNLDALTTDGDGTLYDLKMAVGADTTIGQSISGIGASVMEAKARAFASLDAIAATIEDRINQAKKYNADTSSEMAREQAGISDINFV